MIAMHPCLRVSHGCLCGLPRPMGRTASLPSATHLSAWNELPCIASRSPLLPLSSHGVALFSLPPAACRSEPLRATPGSAACRCYHSIRLRVCAAAHPLRGAAARSLRPPSLFPTLPAPCRATGLPSGPRPFGILCRSHRRRWMHGGGKTCCTRSGPRRLSACERGVGVGWMGVVRCTSCVIPPACMTAAQWMAR